MDARVAMRHQMDAESGITLIETMIAMLVLTVGAIGMAGVFLQGMNLAATAPKELVATQKAAEAIESVFGARDSHTVTWDQLRNVSHGGIFVDAATPMKVAGADGVLNTADDGAVESVELPGPDQNLATPADNKTETLTGFTRQITISDLSQILRQVTVTITYQAGATTRTYALTAYISAFA